MKTLLLVLLLVPCLATAQDCDPARYRLLMREATEATFGKKPDYQLAVNKLLSAKTCQPDSEAVVNVQLVRVFEEVNRQRELAVKNEREANKQRRRAEEQTKVAETEKEKSEAARKEVESQLIATKLTSTKKLPENFEALIPLDSLDCQGWFMTSLSPGIGIMKNLKWLNLDLNKLESLPSEIGDLENLEFITFGLNSLTEIPHEIGNLRNLKVLILSSNLITDVPLTIGNLKKLEWLDVSGNKLTSIPIEVGDLYNLQGLNLGGNQIEALPMQLKKLSKLPRLRYLSLSHSNLSILPEEISTLQNLEEIDLRGNQLTTLPVDVLKQMPHLKKLVLKMGFYDGDNPNPFEGIYIESLRREMPWCEIVWE